MPKISLVICLYKERDLLERLLGHAEGCYDDLVVVHDGREEGETDWTPRPPGPELAIDWATVPADAPLPEVFAQNQIPEQPGSLREFILLKGGRFFEHPRVGSLEGQSPFAWWAARHDWILRLDADEFPSPELRQWLQDFRSRPEPEETISGYTCIWPHWDGRKPIGDRWPDGRIFLLQRKRVKFLGITEFPVRANGRFVALALVLNHQPKRKSFGFRNILLRKQCWQWRKIIALTLLEAKPSLLPRWNYCDEGWPIPFSRMVQHPWRHIYNSVFVSWRWGLKSILRHRLWPVLYCFYAAGWHHALVCIEIIRLKFREKNRP